MQLPTIKGFGLADLVRLISSGVQLRILTRPLDPCSTVKVHLPIRLGLPLARCQWCLYSLYALTEEHTFYSSLLAYSSSELEKGSAQKLLL